MEDVSNVCCCGDIDLVFEIFVEIMKFIGNSVYGLMIMIIKEKYVDIICCGLKENVSYYVFKKSFRNLMEFDNNYFEIEFVKLCIFLDLFI